MNLRQAAQQALEALEMVMSHGQAVQKAKDTLRAALAEPEQEPVNKYCCHACFNKSGQFFLDRMILCPKCGNKRCPKASHHDLPCTNSNEPGQEGSIYTAPTQRKPQTTHWEGCEAVHPECRKPEQKPVAWMSNKDFNPIRIRIMSEAYDLADRGDSEGYNAIKVMCGDVQRMLPPQRKPLTEEEMPTLFVGGLALNSEATTEIVRAVEKAHGIEQTFKEKNT